MALRYTALSLLWHYLQRLPLTFDHFLTKFVLCLVCLWSLCAPLLSSFLSFHDRWRFNFLSRVFFLTTVTKSLLTALLGSLCTIVEIGTFHEKKVRFSILLKKKFLFFCGHLKDKATSGRKVCIMETVETKPDLALAYLEHIFSHTSTREKVLALGAKPLKQLHTVLGNWKVLCMSFSTIFEPNDRKVWTVPP